MGEPLGIRFVGKMLEGCTYSMVAGDELLTEIIPC
jgi:hypothetical protein